MKTEYLIIGSDNFWYASCLTSLKEVKETIEDIKGNVGGYGTPEPIPRYHQREYAPTRGER